MFDALTVPQALAVPHTMCSHAGHDVHEVVLEIAPEVIPEVIPDIAKIKKASKGKSSKKIKRISALLLFLSDAPRVMMSRTSGFPSCPTNTQLIFTVL